MLSQTQVKLAAAASEPSAPPTSASNSAETVALKSRCDNLVKEREAVQTIMEHKIKVLVQSVAQAASAVVAAPGGAPGNSAAAAQALTKVN